METINPEISVSATSPPIRPPFKRRRFDLIKRSKSNVEVAFNEAILKAVKGQNGLKKNILKFLSSNLEAFWTYRGKRTRKW